MTKYQKVSLVLPASAEVALRTADSDPDRRHIKSLIVALRQEGWTLESIAKPIGVSREWIRQLESDTKDIDAAVKFAQNMGFVAPERPVILEKVKTVKPQPSPEVIKRMLELQPIAQSVRGNGTRHRAEAEEYTKLLYEEHAVRGVSLYRLAQELGVTHGALRFRLVRYGYRTTDSTSKVYQPIVDKNRVV